MRIPVQWLADYVDIDLTTHDLAARMTMAGLKVETIEHIGADWQDLVIGRIVALEQHPTSKKPLNVAQVELGDRTITVVTGAQNVRLHDRVPVVLVGGTLPHGPDGEPVVITAKPMAGITSEGMLASARELGISDEHSGIHVLPEDAPVGRTLASVLGGDVLDIETQPNRPDTLSMIGVAREVAAMTGQQVSIPDHDAADGIVEWIDEESISVRIEEPTLCARYTALRIEGVQDQASPTWLASRLEAAGMRPISLLVDITNYVMLEYGQPMHAFDAATVVGGIVVRRAVPGERLRTLDGVERVLSPENLLIADSERAVGIAGVMGGENSEIGPQTECIILESATFNSASVRRTASALSLRTEASSRFEKGLPPEQTVPAARRYVQLLAQITGRPLRVYRMSDVWLQRPEARTVTMPMRDLHRLTGIDISRDVAAETLSMLEFEVVASDDRISATVPFWRRADIFLSADLVEEVVRLVGYETVPLTLPRRTLPPPSPAPHARLTDVLRERLLGMGLSEAVTGTLTSTGRMARLFADDSVAPDWSRLIPNAAGVFAQNALVEPMRLLNPPTRERDVLRLALVPQLVEIVAHNAKHTHEDVAFFEVASTYFPRTAELPYERRTLGIVLSGARRRPSWQEPRTGGYTFYDIKGVVEALLDALHVPDWSVDAAHPPFLHPGRGAAVRLRGHEVAWLGELHPLVSERFDVEHWPVQVAEVDLDALFAASSDARIFRPLPRYPSAHRDIAVVVEETVPAEQILRVVREAGDDVVESASIFDVYSGDPLPRGVKSVAVGMQLRAPGGTLAQDEIEEVMQRITRLLDTRLHASLRE